MDSGEPDMDLTRRAMLNDFGLVQHAVFESADHNAVYVIYCHTQKPFVHTALTKELGVCGVHLAHSYVRAHVD